MLLLIQKRKRVVKPAQKLLAHFGSPTPEANAKEQPAGLNLPFPTIVLRAGAVQRLARGGLCKAEKAPTARNLAYSENRQHCKWRGSASGSNKETQ